MGSLRPRPVRAGIARVSRRSGRGPGALQSRAPPGGSDQWIPELSRRARDLLSVADRLPEEPLGAEARAWRATLSDLQAREEEATRLKLQVQSRDEEATRLKQQLRWREEEAARIKSQLQLREEETSGLKAQIQQLRRVDLNLERRR
jgi:hypothetical protein